MSEHFSELVSSTDPRWRELLARVEHDFYALPAYAEFCAARDRGRAAAFVYQGPEGALLIPLILLPVGEDGWLHASCPYGYPGIATSAQSSELLLAALPRFAAASRAARAVTAFIRLHPLFQLPHAPLERAGTLVVHGETVSLDLSGSAEQSWRAIRSTHRRHIAAAEKAGYVAEMDWSELSEYVDCYLQTMRRVGAGETYLFDAEYVEGLRRALGAHLHLCLVRRGTDVTCAGLFSDCAGIIQYHLGGTKDTFLPDSPMKLMFDFIRRWGHARGARTLHLGGGVGGQADALFHFKAGFSERRHAFRTLRMVLDQPQYARLCAAAGAEPAATGRFPAFLR